jgi:hypothetical protein
LATISGVRSGDRLVEPGHDSGRRAGRRQDAEPGIAAVLAVALLAQGRDLGEIRMADLRQHGEAAQLA